MSTLAVTLDGSSLSQTALPHALARLRDGDTLVLIRVASSPADERSAREHLEQVAASYTERAHDVTTVVRSGPAVHEILKVLESCEADLLVTASHGHSGWQRARLGSVAEEVTRRSPCPVWLVREDHRATSGLGTVVVALDGTAHGETALEFVREWLPVPGRLILLGATDLVTDLRTSLRSPEEARDASLQAVKTYLEERAHWLRNLGRSCELQVRDSTAASAIVDVARTENADLVVVGTHGRSGLLRWALGSVAETVMRESPCPVAVVSPEAVWSSRAD